MEKYGNAAIIQTTKSIFRGQQKEPQNSPPLGAESGLGSNPSVISNLFELQSLLSRDEILPVGLMGVA